MNTIYLQMVGVSERGTAQDRTDFVEYAQCWADFVAEHHHVEETLIFERIERLAEAPGIMQANIEQHNQFHPGLDLFSVYLADVRLGKEQFDGRKLMGIVDGFMPILTQHLHDEIQTLKTLSVYEHKTDWKKRWMEMSDEIVSKVINDPVFKVGRNINSLSCLVVYNFVAIEEFLGTDCFYATFYFYRSRAYHLSFVITTTHLPMVCFHSGRRCHGSPG